MEYLLKKSFLLWICLVPVICKQSGGYRYSPPPGGPPAGLDGSGPVPLSASGSGPGPLSGTGPTGPTGFIGPGPTGPVGPGPIGPGPIGPGPVGPAPFGGPVPYGPGPLPYAYPVPYYYPRLHGPGCNLLQFIKKHLGHLFQPVLLTSIGMLAVWLVRSFLFHHLGIFAVRMGRVLEETDQRTLEVLTDTVQRAIIKGVCLEEVACQMGRRASSYSIHPSLLRALKSASDEETLLYIFQKTASGEETSCEPYKCHGSRMLLDYVMPLYNENSTVISGP